MLVPADLTEKLDQFYTSAYAYRQKEIVDNVFTSSPFWYLMTKKGRARPVRGGRSLEFPLEYSKSEQVQWYSKGDTVGMADFDPLTMARYQWKYIVASIVRFGIDDQQLSGKNAHINLANTKFNNLQRSMEEALEAALFGDGTGDGGKACNGLKNLVADDGQGTVGGITSSDNTWWQNKVKAASGAFTLSGVSDMRTAYNDASNGGRDFPDVLITNQAIHELYEDEGLEYYQFSDRKLVDLGFTALKFKGAVLTWMPSCPTAHIYFLNTKYLFWAYDPIMNAKMTPWKPIPNQVEDRVAQIITAGNLVVTNRSRQCVIPDMSS